MITHAQLNQQLSELYASDCCSSQVSPTGGDLEGAKLASPTGGGLEGAELEKLITTLLRAIFKDQSIADAPEALKEMFAAQLWAAVVKGYGSDISDVDFDSPDYDMLTALKEDIYDFSSGKYGMMTSSLFNELMDSDGRVRSWTEYRDAAHTITNSHVHTWLKAERNLAITSAQAASKWVNIIKNRDDLPLLMFDAVIDDHTTEICRNFNGITLPIDHWFWKQYYIPNHYGERSLIRQLDEGETTDESTIVFPEKIPDMFKVNLAELKKIFPPDHPYYSSQK